MKILNVVGARPNLMKAAPVLKAQRARPRFDGRLVHTGQHADDSMSGVFFEELGLPHPDFTFKPESKNPVTRISQIMTAFDELLARERPDLVLVFGDVDSTLACAITAAKRGVRLAHVEAGLRSFDRTMPEEINRIVTDSLSDLLFTTSRQAGQNLSNEGIPARCIHFVGNVMIDTLCQFRERAEALRTWTRFGVRAGAYLLATLHRPSNVDDFDSLNLQIEALLKLQEQLPVLFPVHPRTSSRIEEFGLLPKLSAAAKLHLCEPLGYLEFLSLMMDARIVLTDSGGIQEETTFLGVPCLTLRDNTERPETIEEGTNVLVGTQPNRIVRVATDLIAGDRREGKIPELWDGQAAERIVEILDQIG